MPQAVKPAATKLPPMPSTMLRPVVLGVASGVRYSSSSMVSVTEPATPPSRVITWNQGRSWRLMPQMVSRARLCSGSVIVPSSGGWFPVGSRRGMVGRRYTGRKGSSDGGGNCSKALMLKASTE